MIGAIAWYCAHHCGFLSGSAGSRSVRRPAPHLAEPAEVVNLVGHPVKYYPRMTPESRVGLCAASLALQAAWPQRASGEIGLLAADYGGALAADLCYFDDYVTNGRSLSRGNLFIYTLPSSALGEIAIALSLQGPSLHLHADTDPLAALLRHAERLVYAGEADGMLVLWNTPEAAVCFAVAPATDGHVEPAFPREPQLSPLELANRLAASVETERT